MNLEFVVTGDTVLRVVVSGLDDELSGLSNLLVGLDSPAERLSGASVQEESERTGGGGEVLLHHHELDYSVLRSVNCEVGRLAVHLSLTNPLSGNEQRVLVGDGGSFLSTCEVDLAVVVLEANSPDNEWLATRNLSHLGFNAGNSVRRSNNLGNVEEVKIVQPTGVPSTEDDKAGLIRVVDHGGVLTNWGLLFVLRDNGLPFH